MRAQLFPTQAQNDRWADTVTQIGSVYTRVSLPACFKITPKSNEMQETTWNVYSDFCQALKYPRIIFPP